MPVDVDAIIREVGADGEAAETIRQAFTKAPKLADGFLRQADYSRNVQAVQTREKALDSEYDTLGKWKAEQDAEYQRSREAADKAAREALAAKQALERAAKDAGKTVAEYLRDGGDVEPVTTGGGNGNKGPQPIDTSKFVDLETLGRSAIRQLENTAEMIGVMAEHRALFGKDIDDPKKLVDGILAEAKRGNTSATLRSVWEQEFKVADRRAELNEQGIAKRVKDAEDAARADERSKIALGGGGEHRPAEFASPALAAARQGGRMQGPSEGVRKSVEDFQKRRVARASNGT